MNCIAEYRGDIVKFCGDSVMVMWPCSQLRKHDLHTVVTRCAAECALTLIVECGHYVADHDGSPIEFSIHCAIGSGEFNSFFVGHDDRWEHLVYSEEMKPIESCLNLAKQGQIVCTPESMKLIRDYFEFDEYSRLVAVLPVPVGQENTPFNKELHYSTTRQSLNNLFFSGNEDEDPVLYSPINSPNQSTYMDSGVCAAEIADTVPATTVYSSSAKNATFSQQLFDGDYSEMEETANWLKYFVHESARGHLESFGLDHLSEIRQVVTVFVLLIGLEGAFQKGDVDPIQQAMQTCIMSLKKYGGVLRQFVVDDKGCVLIGNFGVPHFTHEDNCARSIEAAFDIRDALSLINVETHIGITRGNAYCGLVGTYRRCEFAMMGSCVNLAARLMSTCITGDIIVDESIYGVTRDLYHFTPLEPIFAKGYTNPVSVFSPTQRRKTSTMNHYTSSRNRSSDMASENSGMIGRENEVKQVTAIVQKFNDTGNGGFVTVIAPAGFGKTRLVTETIDFISSSGLDFIVACGYSSHSRDPYFVIRQVLDEVFTIFPSFQSTTRRRSSVRSVDSINSIRQNIGFSATIEIEANKSAAYDWLSDNLSDFYEVERDGAVDLLSMNRILFLLQPVLGLQFDSLDTIEPHEELNDEYHTESIVLSCLNIAVSTFRIALILENVQFMDRESLTFFNRLWEEKSSTPNCFILQTSRIKSTCIGANPTRNCRTIELLPMSMADSRRLLRDNIEPTIFSALKDDDITKICQQCGGCPQTLKNIARFLAHSSIKDLNLYDRQIFNSSLMNAVLQQCDNLRPDQYLVVKVASVAEMNFTSTQISFIIKQTEQTTVSVAQVLSELMELGLLCKAKSSTARFSFCDANFRDVVYDAMLVEQKTNIHHALGKYFELHHHNDHRYFDIIIYHFSKAGVASKILEYNMKGASEARIRDNNHYALKCYYGLMTASVIVDAEERSSLFPFLLHSGATVSPFVIVDEDDDDNMLNRFLRAPTSSVWFNEHSLKFDFQLSNGIYTNFGVCSWIAEIASIHLGLANLRLAHNWGILLHGYLKLPIITVHSTALQLVLIRGSIASKRLFHISFMSEPLIESAVQTYLTLSRLFTTIGMNDHAEVSILLSEFLVDSSLNLAYSPFRSKVLYSSIRHHLYAGNQQLADEKMTDLRRIAAFTSDEKIQLMYNVASTEIEISEGNWVESANKMSDHATAMVHNYDYFFAVQFKLQAAWSTLIGGDFVLCRQIVDQLEAYAKSKSSMIVSQLLWLRCLLHMMSGDFRMISSLAQESFTITKGINESIRLETVLSGYYSFINSIQIFNQTSFDSAMTVLNAFADKVIPEFYGSILLVFPAIVVIRALGSQNRLNGLSLLQKLQAIRTMKRVFKYLETSCSCYPHSNPLAKALRVLYENQRGNANKAMNLKQDCELQMMEMGAGRNMISLDSPPIPMRFHVGLYHLLILYCNGIEEDADRIKRMGIVRAWLLSFGGNLSMLGYFHEN